MLLNVGSGGGAAAAAPSGGAASSGGATDAPAAKEEEKKEEGKTFTLSFGLYHIPGITDIFVTEKEESDEDMGFGLFD